MVLYRGSDNYLTARVVQLRVHVRMEHALSLACELGAENMSLYCA